MVHGRIVIALPDGETELFVGTALRPNSPMRLYIGAALPPGSRFLAPTLSRAFGGGSVVPLGDGKELRQFSPYGPADIARTPDEAAEWFIGKITAAWDAVEHLSVSDSPTQSASASVGEAAREAAAVRQRVRALEAEPRDDKPSDEERHRHAEHQAEIVALRKDRDEIRLLLGVADTETGELKLALRDARDSEQIATQLAAEAEAERDRVVARLDELRQQATVESTTGLSLQQLTDGIVDLLRISLGDGSITVPAKTALLERAYALVSGEQRVVEMLAEHYLRVDRPDEAIAVLESLGAQTLSPTSAALLAEAYLLRKQPPPDDVLERADWSFSGAANLLPEAVGWLSTEDALQMSTALGRNPPISLDRWFAVLSESLPDANLDRLHSTWTSHDPDSAAHAMLQWIDRGRVTIDKEWVVAGLRKATSSGDGRDTVQSSTLLVKAALRTADRGLLEFVATHGPRRLVGRDWLDVGMRVAQAAAQLRGSLEPTEQEALFVVDLYWPARAEGHLSMLRSLRPLAQRIHLSGGPEVRSLLDPVLRDGQGQEELPTVETAVTVEEVLDRVAIRHPGLLVLKEARESAKARGARGLRKALQSLEALGALADEFAAGAHDQAFDDKYRQLPGYKSDVSDSAKQEFRKDYERTLRPGRLILLGPHIDGGGRDGRIYFYIDRELRRIVIGHVGKHLRGRRDT